ncbi:MAG TPA: hypothetical protein VE777_10025 [Gaiellales bacterium]|nr:hypothetical protein [Gaiellales bacterium]
MSTLTWGNPCFPHGPLLPAEPDRARAALGHVVGGDYAVEHRLAAYTVPYLTAGAV